ncbi:MAG: hypothetical protein AAGF11_26150 [Myxococcota bacterium]
MSWNGAAQAKPTSFDEWIEQATAQRERESFAESARSFVAAVEVLPEDEQVRLMAEIAINSAVDDYRLAQQREPGNMALLEEELAFLERLDRAYAKAGAGGMPPALVDELSRVRTGLAELRKGRQEQDKEAATNAEAAKRAEAARKAEAAKAAEAAREADALRSAEAASKGDQDAKRRRVADRAILGSGVVSFVGGTALLANGAWNLGNIRRRGDELLAEVEISTARTADDRAAVREGVEDWQARWRGIGTGLVVGGAIAMAAGVGLTAWGAVRMRKRQTGSRRASVVSPIVSRERVGMQVMVRF